MTHTEISALFNALFRKEYRVHMHGGFIEPLYLPAQASEISPGLPSGFGEIRYTRDYAASALHEAAHWCLAGIQRRSQVDYGYWYQPPPRPLQQRKAFFRAERCNQALELIFSAAAGISFRISADDLELPSAEQHAFAAAVEKTARNQLAAGLPPRARAFVQQLRTHDV